jgi:hypothetical protein
MTSEVDDELEYDDERDEFDIACGYGDGEAATIATMAES